VPIVVYQCRRGRLFGDVAPLQARHPVLQLSDQPVAPTAELAVQPTVLCHGSRSARVLVASPQQGSYTQ